MVMGTEMAAACVSLSRQKLMQSKAAAWGA